MWRAYFFLSNLMKLPEEKAEHNDEFVKCATVLLMPNKKLVRNVT